MLVFLKGPASSRCGGKPKGRPKMGGSSNPTRFDKPYPTEGYVLSRWKGEFHGGPFDFNPKPHTKQGTLKRKPP